MDLLDDLSWSSYKARLMAGEFSGCIASPPRGTWSSVREHRPGPPLLRTREYNDGLRNLPPDLQKEVRSANILADHAVEACEICISRGLPCALEKPWPLDDRPSLLLLPRAQRLLAHPSVHSANGHQCSYGAITTKPTTWVYYAVNLEAFNQSRCNHQPTHHRWRDSRAAHAARSHHIHHCGVAVLNQMGLCSCGRLSACSLPLAGLTIC